MNPSALITGVSGQDGAYLAAQLLAQGSRVIGALRPDGAAHAPWRLGELGIAAHPRLDLRPLDLADIDACRALLRATQPSVLFHFAGRSQVAESFRDPLGSAQVNAMGTLHLLEALRTESAQSRFVLASTAELFGDPDTSPQSELTPFRPRSPYAVAKQFAHAASVSYRESFGLHASCAILFNHESPLRDAGFVTRKIAAAAARLARGQGEPLALGNLAAQRDFGFAPEYVAAMAAMAQHERPDDYVLATGVATTVREFVAHAFAAAGVALEWRGGGSDEHAVELRSGRPLVRVDPAFYRRLDARTLVGDAAKARATLAFAPATDVATLARIMVEAELRRQA